MSETQSNESTQQTNSEIPVEQTPPQFGEHQTATATGLTGELQTETTKEAPAEKDAPVIPEKYEFEAIDGLEINADLVEMATPIFKEVGLTNEAAQKLANLFAKIEQSKAESHVKSFNERQERYAETLRSDKEITFDKNGTNVAAVEAINKVFNPKEVEALNAELTEVAAGNLPMLNKLLSRIGNLMKEPKFETGSKTEQQRPRVYEYMNP